MLRTVQSKSAWATDNIVQFFRFDVVGDVAQQGGFAKKNAVVGGIEHIVVQVAHDAKLEKIFRQRGKQRIELFGSGSFFASGFGICGGGAVGFGVSF